MRMCAAIGSGWPPSAYASEIVIIIPWPAISSFTWFPFRMRIEWRKSRRLNFNLSIAGLSVWGIMTKDDAGPHN